MADTSVVARRQRADGAVPYELGKPNWEALTIPDIRHSSSSLQIAESRLIDVLILGDGFLTQAEFEEGLQDWIDYFYQLNVYDVFQGAFRIRGLYRESSARASSERESYYRIKVTDDNKKVPDDNWWESDRGDGLVFRHRVFEDVDSFADMNIRRYPSGFSFDDSNMAIGDWLFGMYRNLVVSMLVRTSRATDVSGLAFRLARPSPNEDRTVRIATGTNVIHEFSHAFGLLSDEYIEGRESHSTRSNPKQRSVLTLSNLTYSDKHSDIPWFHLSSWGRDRRQASGTNRSPILGWIWVGGRRHRNVWHSEYHCLMNGTHDNFRYTQDQPNDPTAQPDGSYKPNTGADLRDRLRFCLWCQEVVTLRILERTDQLVEQDDPPSFIDKGQRWYQRWTTELRDNYWQLFDVSQQIVTYEDHYATMNPGPNHEALETSDLYSPFREDAPTVAGPSSVGADEWLVLLG